MTGDMTALIYPIGSSEWVLALSVDKEIAENLARQVLGANMPEPEPEIINDTLAEMSNVIAGQVQGCFEGTPFEFDISTPTVVSGTPHHVMHRPDLPCTEMAFTSDIGAFHLQLCVRGRDIERKG